MAHALIGRWGCPGIKLPPGISDDYACIADGDGNYGRIEDILRVHHSLEILIPLYRERPANISHKSNHLRYSDVDAIRYTGATIYISL